MTLLLITAMMVSGCARWKESGELTSVIGQPPADSIAQGSSGSIVKTSASQVVLDVEFVSIDLQNTPQQKITAIWDWVDESALDNRERYQLFENGMRTGLVVDQQGFRKHLQSMTAKKDVVDEFLASASVASNIQGGGQQIAMRLGRRYELPIREPLDGSHITMVRIDDETVGRTLNDPQFLFALQATQLTTDRRMRLRLRPEIQHGQMRQQFVGGGSNSGLRIDQRRESWSLPSLDQHWTLGQDDLIVLTIDQWSTSSSLATQMFAGKNADLRDEQLVILIRVKKIPMANP